MEIMTCYEYDDKEMLETVADRILTPFCYLMNGKTVQLVDMRIVDERTSERTWGNAALAVTGFAFTVITGAFLYSALVKWTLPKLKILPKLPDVPRPADEIKGDEPPVVNPDLDGLSAFPDQEVPENTDDRWLSLMEQLNALGETPSANDFISVIHQVDTYFDPRWGNYTIAEMDILLKAPITILSRCKDPDKNLRNALIREINNHGTLPLIESIFAHRFVPGMHSEIFKKTNPNSAGMFFHRLSHDNKNRLLAILDQSSLWRGSHASPDQPRFNDIYNHLDEQGRKNYIPLLTMNARGQVVKK